MVNPVITLADVESYYGMWCLKTRTITLSYKLLENCPWDRVIQVLKHEMAHQYVDEVFCKRDTHGPHFQKACQLLRVELWARRSGINELDLSSNVNLKQNSSRVIPH